MTPSDGPLASDAGPISDGARDLVVDLEDAGPPTDGALTKDGAAPDAPSLSDGAAPIDTGAPDAIPALDLGPCQACSAAFTCQNGRCTRTYDAYSGAGGGLCSSHPFLASSVWCEPGDLCLGSDVRRCVELEYPKKGDRYTADGGSGAGVVCSKWGARCQPGDLCIDQTMSLCERAQ